MIYYSIPYSTDKNIGKNYNDFMELLPHENDYACFVDGDTIFTTSNYGHIISEVVKRYSNIGCFTALTNRVNCKWQVHSGIDIDNNDIAYHREFGKNIQNIYGTYCEDVTNHSPMSGFFILLKKQTWLRVGKFSENRMLGIDNDIHRKIIKNNEKIFQMKGVYLYHWYRWPNFKNKEHLL